MSPIQSTATLQLSLPIQRPGLRTRVRCRRYSALPRFAALFYVRISCNGGCAWETFGSAGFLYLRFLSLRTAATHSPENERGSSHLIWELYRCMPWICRFFVRALHQPLLAAD
ncbi:hypothetical protein CF597_16010 [Pseudomonas sp. PSB1]|nr:hypothetical protein [Pseudomonas sp. PSB1]